MAVKLKILDFRKLYKDDIKSGNGFLITDIEGLDNKKRTKGGIYSPKFGTSWGDNDAFAERYKCECGHLIGKLYDDMVCPQCNTKVRFVDNNFKMTAWLKLEDHYIIHPQLYYFVEYIIGNRKIIDAMLKFDCPTDKKGKISKKTAKPPYRTGDPNIDVFLGKGMSEFHRNFDAILLHFYKIKLKKSANPAMVKSCYDFIQEHRKSVFTKYFPIFSLLLRPIIITDDNFRFGEINKKYARLTKKVFALNSNELSSDRKENKVEKNLYYAQSIVNDIYDMILDNISKKEGHIRSNILGNRFNYTARNVIVPGSRLKCNEIKLSYHDYLELMKPQIVNVMSKMENITIYEASECVEDSFINYNKKVYEIMQYILKNTKGGNKVLINRNPTINFGSILAMKIKEVKNDFNDYTMSLPIFVLGVLAGDFDGDVLNIISLKGKKFSNGYYELYNPRDNMIISRNDGEFNNAFNLIKDQLIILHTFARLGKDTKNIYLYKKGN